ncbi:MAG: twin-arginine translocase subunit TatC, partial [Streptococcus salivarius]|nr:twin-arginine translocase subunit TatC [Streptococcus salivarius]
MARSKDEMTIVEHLVEFRRRFIAVVLCFFLVFCITLLFAGELYAYLTRGFDKPL